MAKSKTRRKTTSLPRRKPKAGEYQQLHIKVSSPRIVMHQLYQGAAKGIKCAVFMILSGLILYGAYRGVHHFFLGNEKYRLQEIDLQTNGYLDHSRVVQLAGINLEASIFDVDTEKVRESLNALPEVMDSVVERRFPGRLKIRIEERIPVGWIQCESLGFPGRQDGGILVDKNGVTFPGAGGLWQASRNLPLFIVKAAKSEDFEHGSKTQYLDLLRALHLVEKFQDADIRKEWLPQEVILVNDYSMEVIANDGSHAVFGMYEHQRQLDDFITIREHALKTQRTVRHINLIPKRNIPVKFAGDPVMVRPNPIATP